MDIGKDLQKAYDEGYADGKADTVRKVKEHILKSLSNTTTVGVGFLETLLEDIEEEIIGDTNDHS